MNTEWYRPILNGTLNIAVWGIRKTAHRPGMGGKYLKELLMVYGEKPDVQY